jgi:hypothetical protein
MVAPKLVGECEEPRVGALELVDSLHIVAQNEQLEIVVHVHRILHDETVIEEGHVLRLIQDDDVHFRERRSRFQIFGQNMADPGVCVGSRVIIFHGHTVIGMHVEVGDVLCFDFVLDFHP